MYQPGLLFVPFGLSLDRRDHPPAARQLRAGSGRSDRWRSTTSTSPRTACHLHGGGCIDYDALVVASGSVLVPEETEGLTGPGWMEKVFTFYTPEGATALHHALEAFEGGRLAVNIVDLPIKCPVAPLEFCFLADSYFHDRRLYESRGDRIRHPTRRGVH